MVYLLRALIVFMFLGVSLTMLLAYRWMDWELGHIRTAIAVFIYAIFTQAFVMFYFIGVARFVDNVFRILKTEKNLDELFVNPPDDLTPYLKQVARMHYEAKVGRRQTVPWAILMLVLGTIAFLLGAAHDTGLVDRAVHSGVAYGFFVVMTVGFFRQWYYLGRAHRMLRRLKGLFEIPDGQM